MRVRVRVGRASELRKGSGALHRVDRVRAAVGRRLECHRVAALVESAHVLDAIVNGDETREHVPQPRAHFGTGVAHATRTEGDHALVHLYHPVHEFEEGAAAIVVRGRRERDRERKERRVGVHVCARV